MFGAGYFGFARYTNDIALLDILMISLIQENTLLSHRLDLLQSQSIQDNTYLTYSGSLHYIALDGHLGSGVLMTDSYDAVRFHNITTSPVVLDIYDSPDTSVTPITHLSIGSGSMSFFALKKSGIYIYRIGEQDRSQGSSTRGGQDHQSDGTRIIRDHISRGKYGQD